MNTSGPSASVPCEKKNLVFSNEWLRLFASLVFLSSGCVALDIKGVLKKDVILPCVVEYKDEFNYSLLVVNWQRSENDSVVHTFFYGSSQPQYQEVSYRGRTHIFYESLPEGNASIVLRNLTKSDAGCYTCHVILKESTGYTTQHVNLTVEDVAELTSKKSRVWLSLGFAAILPIWALTVCFHIMYRKFKRQHKHEQILKKYKEFMKDIITNKYKNIFPRQLLVARSHFSTSQIYDASFGDKNTIVNENELFTPGSKHLMSRRMLLLGNVGTGKSYLCKWLEGKWLWKENILYKCIIYVHCKKIHMENETTSVKKILQQIYNDLPEVLHMSEVLLILDGLDHLAYGEKKESLDTHDIEVLPETNKTFDIDISFELNTLVENIIMKKLLPETDVLLVSRHDLPINKLCKCCTFILQDLNDESITTGNLEFSDRFKSISDITYNPAFVVMMHNLSTSCDEKFKEYKSPYELLANLLQNYLRELKVRTTEHDSFRQLASQTYENLITGQKNQSTKQWEHFLNMFNCSAGFKYQCKILRDMLAALHCTWEIRNGESLKDCLDFWMYGSHGQRNSALLKPAAEEHNTKYYHFIRFFMRLLPLSNNDTLCNNTPDIDNNMRKEITTFFKANMKNLNDKYEYLKLIHCVFELNDEHVTNELSSSLEEFSLFNTPLNSLDTRALAYFLRKLKLEKLDLRLCELTDKDVKQMENIVKNTRYVALSSNNLTSTTGILLEEVLQRPDCLTEKLALGTNNLGPDGAQALWRSLENNSSLRSLYLYDNNIGDKGTGGMAKHLQKNNSLRELHLCLNVFGVIGIKSIETLKMAKNELSIVLRIAEDLDLFKYVEEKVKDLNDTWSNYHQGWLIKLLEAVKADLESSSCNADANPTQQRVDKLVEEITAITNIMKEPSKTNGERIKSKLASIGAHIPFHCFREQDDSLKNKLFKDIL